MAEPAKGLILFDSAVENGERFGHWPTRIWPPPDRLWLVSVAMYPSVVIPVLEDDLATVGRTFEDEPYDLMVTPFRLVTWSKLPEEHGMEHVVRAAQYVPE